MSGFNGVLGKRVLIRRWYSDIVLWEVRVEEISPSGEVVKLRWESGNASWVSVRDYVLVEELPEIEEKKE